MSTYAYARVSATDQNIARQLDAFTAYGIDPEFIFSDKKSGKDFERENYKKLLQTLKQDDLLIIKSIDRLGRNYDSIIREWSYITNEIKADILVLDMPLLDTRTKANTLVGKFISDIVLQVLSFVAENERENIRQRQKEGIVAAKNRGVKFGRPKRIYEKEFIKIVYQVSKKEISITEALRLSGLKRCNFYYHMNRILSEKNKGCLT